jgi:hypothetical protein
MTVCQGTRVGTVAIGRIELLRSSLGDAELI